MLKNYTVAVGITGSILDSVEASSIEEARNLAESLITHNHFHYFLAEEWMNLIDLDVEDVWNEDDE